MRSISYHLAAYTDRYRARMHELLAAMDDRILVEYGSFGLMDLDVDACPRPWPEGSSSRNGLVTVVCTNRLDFVSTARDHKAFVRLEVWLGEPPQPEGNWAGGNSVGPSRIGTFDIGAPGRYHVRVWRQGADDVAALDKAGERIPDGTERYLLQFWII
jgi:hypothetical protein